MISNNQRLVIFVCLAGLTLLLASHAAEIPKAPGQADPQSPSQMSPPPKGSPEQQPTMGDDDDEQEEGDDGYCEYDEDYEDDEEEDDEYDEDDEDDEEGSPEEELAYLAEEHFVIKSECDQMNQTIASSKSKVDSELKEAYQACHDDLKRVRSQMIELLSQITQD